MQISAKRILSLCAIACVLIVTGIGLAYGFDVYRQATMREVSLDSNPGFGNMEGGPIRVLAAAVNNDRLSARFRVYWMETWGTSASEGWMLYDRRRSTLQYEDVTRSAYFPAEHTSYSVTDVTDDIVRKVSTVFDSDLPKVLPKHGCHIQIGDGFLPGINADQQSRPIR